MLILLVGLSLGFTAQSQNRSIKDTTKICAMDSTKICKKDSTKQNLQETPEVYVENTYQYYNNDDVYYSPYGYYGYSWFDNPWYWSYPIIIDRNGRRYRDFSHRHKEFIGGNKHLNNKNFGRNDNKPIVNQRRTNPITDGQNGNGSTMYTRPQMRGQLNRPPMQQSRPSMQQSRPPMNQNRPPMQQSRPPMSQPVQHFTSPPSRPIRRGPFMENSMFDDTYLNEPDIDSLILDDLNRMPINY